MAGFERKLAGIAILGLAARTWFMMSSTRFHAPTFDASYYDLSAKAISQGHWFVDPVVLYSQHRLAPSALYPPAYTLVLALFDAVGIRSRPSHLFVGCCLGAVTIVLCGYLARKFLSDRASLAVAALAAVYPPLLGADTSGMSETLFVPLILVTLLVAMECRAHRVWPWALMGVTIGLAALTRGDGLIYLPVLAVPIAVYSDGSARRKVALLGLTTAVVVVMLAPWAIRNEVTFGSPVLLANDSSTVIGGANCAAAYHGPYLGSWVPACLDANRPGAQQMTEVQLNDKIRQEGLSYMAGHLGRVPLVVAVRVLRTYGFYAPTQEFRLAVHQGREYGAERIGWLFYILLLPFAILGARRLFVRRADLPPGQLIALVAPLVAVTLVTVITYGTVRFRIAAEPTLLVLAVMGATVVGRGLPRRPGRAETVAPLVGASASTAVMVP